MVSSKKPDTLSAIWGILYKIYQRHADTVRDVKLRLNNDGTYTLSRLQLNNHRLETGGCLVSGQGWPLGRLDMVRPAPVFIHMDRRGMGSSLWTSQPGICLAALSVFWIDFCLSDSGGRSPKAAKKHKTGHTAGTGGN